MLGFATLESALRAHQSGNLDLAAQLYRDILRDDPMQVDALSLLGVIYGSRGNHEEALRLADAAFNVDALSPLPQFHLANILMNAGRLTEAIVNYRELLVRHPQFAEAHYNMGNAMRAHGDWQSATAAYEQATVYKPDYFEVYNNLALCHVHEKKLTEAMAVAEKAVAINADFGDGWITLCNVAEKLTHYSRALVAAENATRLAPDNHYAWFGYGVVLNRLDRNDDAVTAYKKALALKPERADIWDNLGQTYQSMAMLEEAEIVYRKTVEVAGQAMPDDKISSEAEDKIGNRHWHLALIELLRGSYTLGFARYRARFRDVEKLQRPKLAARLWLGEDLNDKTILLYDEQGFGDTLMLLRFLPYIKRRGARIILSVHPALQDYLKNMDGVDQIIVHGDTVSGHDFHASLFDLPHRLCTTLDSLPNKTPYLPMPPIIDVLPNNNRPRLGVVWGGNPLHANDVRRSVPLETLVPFLRECDADLYSLNRDKRAGDDALMNDIGMTDLTPRINNFLQSAGYVAQMSLLITCDTSTAHLAGGLGKKTWVMLPFAPDWRWLTDREDSPWYPTARLFRQPRIGDWAGVVNLLRASWQHS